ncbi:MAG: DNA polymerase III subunit gamma/tau [Proteobacteria bacterium]|nr:DNA polymerase III subunit gamma/tau [Pseudomonadota bacterium]
MSYLVLARKYRPRIFSDLVGQDHVVRPLVNALKTGRLAQAYLFSGARGVGKTTAARILAMALNCRSEGPELPCGECDACRDISEGHAVDVFEIDGASNRGINEIRDLRETVKYMPSQGQYKVYIIDEVHMLTKEAFNALLKTLEEPPAHVVFIFATTEAHKVLPTILSRCQRYDFKRIGLDDIVGRLRDISRTESIEVSDEALRFIAREADGGLRDALSLLDQVVAYAGTTVSDEDVGQALGLIDRALVAGLAEAVLTGQAGDALDLLDRAYGFGYDTKDLSSQVRDWFRALLLVRISAHPEKLLELLDEELTEIRRIAAGHSVETLNFHFNAWLEVQDRLQRSGQPRLVLEALIIRLAQVEPLQPLAELVARLERLLGDGPPPPAAPRAPGRSRSEATSGRGGADPVASPVREAPAPAPEAPARTPGDWKGFLKLVQAEAPLRLAALGEAHVRVFEPAEVHLAFRDKNKVELLDRSMLSELLSRFLGRRPKLTVEHDPGLAAAGPNRGLNQEERELARAGVLEHPLVKEARQIFSGEIVDVIPEES